MATYAEVIYCKNCKYCYKYYQGEYSKGGYQFTCEKDLKKVGPFDFCSWADYKEQKKFIIEEDGLIKQDPATGYLTISTEEKNNGKNDLRR